MSDIPSRVRIGSQTPRVLRVEDVRSLNVLDEEIVVSDDYAAVDIPTSASADWSRGINVRGYDRIMIFVDLTVGGTATGDMTEFALDVQAGFKQRSTDDADWFDRFSSFGIFTGDSTVLTDTSSLTLDTSAIVPGTAVRFFFDLEVVGHYMRFQPSAAGSPLGGSRVVVKAIRTLS